MVRLFTGHAGKISQVPLFAKAGIAFKTMTLTPTGGRTEDMKLNPSIDFDELCDHSVEFEDSAFAAPFIDSTMVVAVSRSDTATAAVPVPPHGFKVLWLGPISMPPGRCGTTCETSSSAVGSSMLPS